MVILLPFLQRNHYLQEIYSTNTIISWDLQYSNNYCKSYVVWILSIECIIIRICDMPRPQLLDSAIIHFISWQGKKCALKHRMHQEVNKFGKFSKKFMGKWNVTIWKRHLSIPGEICPFYPSDHPLLLKSLLAQKSSPCYLEKQDHRPITALPMCSAPHNGC